MNRDQAVQKLQDVLGKIDHRASDKLDRIAARIRDAKDAVLARYSQVFSPENLDKLTAEEFRSFLLFKNNLHWDCLHRQGGWMTEDMARLREAIGLLIDESIPIRTRLDRLRPSGGDPMVKGLGRAVITAILQVCYPDKYGVLNNTAEQGMKQLGLWPEVPRGATFGRRYEAVNRAILEISPEVGVDLWTLDMLWWRTLNQHAPKGAVASSHQEPVGTVEETTATIPNDLDAAEGVFGLERHLQDFLVDNWQSTELGREWALLEEDGEIIGAYYNTQEVGEIDLLAKHCKDNRWLVIELKRNQASDSTVGQILRYMSWVRKKLACDGATVTGLIICHEIDLKLQYALDGQPNIECLTYQVSFALNPSPMLS